MKRLKSINILIILVLSMQTNAQPLWGDLIPYRKGELWGYADTTGKIIIKPKYTYLSVFSSNLVSARYKGKKVLINKQGRLICKYDYIGNLDNGYARISNDNKLWGLIDSLGKEIVSPCYRSIEKMSEGYAAVYKDKYGYIDSTGKLKVPHKYNTAQPFYKGRAWVNFENKPGSIDKDGNWRFLGEYEYVSFLNNQRAIVFNGQFYGIVDMEDQTIVPFKYRSIKEIKKGQFYMTTMWYGPDRKDKLGLFDSSGIEIIPPIYDQIRWDHGHGGLFQVELNGKYGYIDKSGKEIISPRHGISEIKRNIFSVRINDKIGFYKSDGEQLTKIIYDEVGQFNGAFAYVKINEKYGFIDENGLEITSIKYDDVGNKFPSVVNENETIVKVTVNGKFGYVNYKGKEVVAPVYDEIGTVREDLVSVCIDHKCGFINLNGEIVIPLIYDGISYFSENRAWVRKDGKYFLIDKGGREIVPEISLHDTIITVTGYWHGTSKVLLKGGERIYVDTIGKKLPYDMVYGRFPDKLYIKVTKGGKYGIMDRKGRQIIFPKYDHIGLIDNRGLFKVKISGKSGFIDKYGREYFED
ncbi:MAG: WG repeat-containing protein [Bacteroidetes bacterium]|nr:WG repeat-containing protein [Bacteroidota bacterium]